MAALELRQRKRVLKIGKATGYRRGEHSNGINEVADASKISVGGVAKGSIFVDKKFGGHFADLQRAENRTNEPLRKLIESSLSTGNC